MDGRNAIDLHQYAARNSKSGLFLRYARGRYSRFPMRQTMTLLGTTSIGILASWQLAFAVLIIALVGEVVDCLVLRAIYKKYREQEVPASVFWIAAATGAFQSFTISVVVMLSWMTFDSTGPRIFAATFLISAVVNAAVVRRYFPLGIHLRLAVFASTAITLLLPEIIYRSHQATPEDGFMLVALLLMGYSGTLFVRSVEHGRMERTRFEGELLKKTGDLLAAQTALENTVLKVERLALAARHANDSVVFTSADGRIEWVNEAFTRITGYSYDEAIGKIPGDLLDAPETDPAALQLLRDARSQGVPVRVELQNRTRDDDRIWVEVSMVPVLGPDGKPELFIAVERDISQFKAHQNELAKAREKAEAAAEAKSQFLATISHEIRTPLNGVLGVAELLQETKLDPAQRHYVDTIVDSGNALLSIINDVLDLTKFQAGKVDLRATPFSVSDCVRRALNLMRPAAEKKGLTLQVDVPEHIPTHLGDSDRLRQILLNLLGNAVKFTQAGHVKTSIHVQPRGEVDEISIAIEDTGIGIPEDRLNQVFDSFTQADRTISRQFGGTGLGLTISRLLAQQMGGDIQVKSKLGAGSTFTIVLHLPRAKAEVAKVVGTLTAPKTNIRLLVAEDNKINMFILRELLVRSVGTFEEAHDGQQAVEAYIRHQPDLILMDVSMPILNGQDASRQIRAYEDKMGLRRCPIVALTAYVAAEDAELCRNAGMDEVLTKPPSRAELFRLLERTAATVRF